MQCNDPLDSKMYQVSGLTVCTVYPYFCQNLGVAGNSESPFAITTRRTFRQNPAAEKSKNLSPPNNVQKCKNVVVFRPTQKTMLRHLKVIRLVMATPPWCCCCFAFACSSSSWLLAVLVRMRMIRLIISGAREDENYLAQKKTSENLWNCHQSCGCTCFFVSFVFVFVDSVCLGLFGDGEEEK